MLTLIVAVRKNKKQLPKEFIQGFPESAWYVGIWLSQQDAQVYNFLLYEKEEKCKSSIHNAVQCGVDTADQMCSA